VVVLAKAVKGGGHIPRSTGLCLPCATFRLSRKQPGTRLSTLTPVHSRHATMDAMSRCLHQWSHLPGLDRLQLHGAAVSFSSLLPPPTHLEILLSFSPVRRADPSSRPVCLG
jgi:hypothetical protein